MSLNSYNNPSRRAHLHEVVVDADYGIEVANLATIAAKVKEEAAEMAAMHERMERRARCVASKWYLPAEDRFHLSSAGLAALLRPAISAVWGKETSKSYGTFHSQFGWTVHLGGRFQRDLHYRDYHGGDGFYLRLDEGETILEEAARMAGFLHAFAKAEDESPDWWRPVRRWLDTLVYWTRRKAVWGDGDGEPEKAIMGAIRVSGGPGAFNRRMRKCARNVRAHMIAFGRAEERVSWANIAHGLIVTGGRLNKAAIVAVASHIRAADNGEEFNSFREAREWLTDLHLCKVEDKSDGVEARREAEPRIKKLGVEVFRVVIQERHSRRHKKWVVPTFQWLVRSADSRTYHSKWGKNPKEAMHEAIRAWQKQNKLITAMEVDFIGFLTGEMGFCPLVARSDSYSAGNCEVGTDSWVRERGWADREFIPAIWLIPHLEHRHVRNVAVKLYHRHIERGAA